MTPEHRATLTRLLAIVEAGGYVYPADARDCIPALRAVLAVPEAGEGGAWESAEAFAARIGATPVDVDPSLDAFEAGALVATCRRDAQTAARLDAIRRIYPATTARYVPDVAEAIDALSHDLRGLHR